MQDLLQQIVRSDATHAKWLNSLSFLENTGARKISACEDRYQVSYLQLKHAAEEHRHAYYLKKQLKKLSTPFLEAYTQESLLAPITTQHYLNRLDVACTRYLKNEMGLEANNLRYAAYLLVTYAIEVRADDLYPQYQAVLEQQKSSVMVKSIIIEEQGHLEEMIAQLEEFDENWKLHAGRILKIETNLFEEWLKAIQYELKEHE